MGETFCSKTHCRTLDGAFPQKFTGNVKRETFSLEQIQNVRGKLSLQSSSRALMWNCPSDFKRVFLSRTPLRCYRTGVVSRISLVRSFQETQLHLASDAAFLQKVIWNIVSVHLSRCFLDHYKLLLLNTSKILQQVFSLEFIQNNTEGFLSRYQLEHYRKLLL